MSATRRTLIGLGLGVAALVLLLEPDASGGERDASRPVRIGLVGTLFRDVPDGVVTAMTQPFNRMMVAQTGMTGELVKAGDCHDLARQLTEDGVQLGLFHGIEFAWARQKYPDLQPLMLAVNEKTWLRALVVTKANAPINGLADLKGKTLSVPSCSRNHCLLFLERGCSNLGKKPEELAGKVVTAPSCVDALDDVAEGVAQAALVDGVSWNYYTQRKPGRSAKLKLAVKSEWFPAAVVAYYPGSLSKAELHRFREGMVSANQTTLGKQMLMLWKMTSFQEVPKDFEQSLKDIAKAYPPEEAPTKK